MSGRAASGSSAKPRRTGVPVHSTRDSPGLLRAQGRFRRFAHCYEASKGHRSAGRELRFGENRSQGILSPLSRVVGHEEKGDPESAG